MPVSGLSGAQRAIDAALGIGHSSSSSSKHDHQLCLSLLPLFCFTDTNSVMHDDWLRVVARLHGMASDTELWQQLVDAYGDKAILLLIYKSAFSGANGAAHFTSFPCYG